MYLSPLHPTHQPKLPTSLSYTPSITVNSLISSQNKVLVRLNSILYMHIPTEGKERGRRTGPDTSQYT